MASFYSIADVLNVAQIHPFYTPSVRYPPSPDEIAVAVQRNDRSASGQLSRQPLLRKDRLYKTIERLYADTTPENHYRTNSYLSITGGGSGKSLPMVFLTDAEENQNQRLAMSQIMKAIKMVDRTDWVLNIHPGGLLYRALDLSTQNIEQAGGTVLCAGHKMPHERSLEACIQYRVNVITSDSAHMLNFAHYVASLPRSARSELKISKVICTCELLTLSKRRYLTSVFGPLTFFSMFASAETGPWAVATLDARTTSVDGTTDFLYDTRAMHIEVLSLNSKIWTTEPDSPPVETDFMSDGTAGHLILTSLQRLKNPLVRYVSGDIGSLHSASKSSYPQIDPELREHVKVLRLHGRDKRFSFKWLGDYYEFESLDQVMATEDWGILQWQIIIQQGKDWEGSDSLELRLMRRSEDGNTISKEELIQRLRNVFYLTELTEKLFSAVFLESLEGFERSSTSSKIVRFIDSRPKTHL
ncbi:hypothetical protein ACLMJK_009455 [Lecanora helva]